MDITSFSNPATPSKEYRKSRPTPLSIPAVPVTNHSTLTADFDHLMVHPPAVPMGPVSSTGTQAMSSGMGPGSQSGIQSAPPHHSQFGGAHSQMTQMRPLNLSDPAVSSGVMCSSNGHPHIMNTSFSSLPSVPSRASYHQIPVNTVTTTTMRHPHSALPVTSVHSQFNSFPQSSVPNRSSSFYQPPVPQMNGPQVMQQHHGIHPSHPQQLRSQQHRYTNGPHPPQQSRGNAFLTLPDLGGSRHEIPPPIMNQMGIHPHSNPQQYGHWQRAHDQVLNSILHFRMPLYIDNALRIKFESAGKSEGKI